MLRPPTIDTMKRSNAWTVILAGALATNAACAGMLGYEPLEDMEAAPPPERRAPDAAPSEPDPIEATPVAPSTYAEAVMQDQPAAYFRFDAADPKREHQGRAPLSIVGTPAVVPGAIARDASTQVALGSMFGGAYLDSSKVPVQWTGPHAIEAWLSVTVAKEAPSTWLLRGRHDGTGNFSGVEGTVVGNADKVFGPTRMRLAMTGGSLPAGAGVAEAPFEATPPASVHVVVMFDGVEMSLWVGGELRANQRVDKREPENDAFVIIGAALQPRAQGEPPGTFVPSWNGTIDELAIYPRVLAAARIQEHNAIGMGKK